MRPDETQMGVPPHWNSYVTVANVDEVGEEGGVARREGARAAVRRDGRRPHGGAAGSDRRGVPVWQAKRSIGAKILNEPGALCWTELTTRDTKAAEAFYTELFGWTPKHSARRRADGVHRVQRRRHSRASA